jgi:hypothetical protein
MRKRYIKDIYIIIIVFIITISSATIYQYNRYLKIMSNQKFTVCKTIKLTSKKMHYKFKINETEYESSIGWKDPDKAHKIGTYYLLLYYPKDPKINSIMYQEVRDSTYYGKNVDYPYKVKVYFWRF